MPTFCWLLLGLVLLKCKDKRLFLLQVWVALFVPSLVYGIHTGCFQLMYKSSLNAAATAVIF